jgi:RNA polymerase sigma-70 factor (ECF subfamily)
VSATSATAEVPRLTEHLFRHESGRLVSMLTGIFGIDRLQLAEDVVQEAMVRALQTWPYDGIPRNPAAWLMQTAKHLALDVIRRERRFHEKEPDVIVSIEQRLTDPGASAAPFFDDEIADDRLRLIFACCHPVLTPDAQTALALKTLCGFGADEIAAAFLSTDVAIAKRLTRAKQTLQEQKVPFEIPSGAELTTRLDGVRLVLYLLFNEGYKASAGESLVRTELCREAIRLTALLAAHPVTNTPATHALLALMLLNAARLPARTDDSGNLLQLGEQDRTAWDRRLIASGLRHLGLAANGDALSEYHLQAGIAACHCAAPDYASTDWPTILAHYDQWLRLTDSPLVALNRAVALAKVEGPEAGIRAVEAIRDRPPLDSYYLTHAVLGELEAERNRLPAATTHFQRALALAELRSEQAFLERKLRDLATR